MDWTVVSKRVREIDECKNPDGNFYWSRSHRAPKVGGGADDLEMTILATW